MLRLLYLLHIKAGIYQYTGFHENKTPQTGICSMNHESKTPRMKDGLQLFLIFIQAVLQNCCERVL